MAGIATIDVRSSLEALYEEYLYTVVRLLASPDPDVKALAAPFEAWEEAWWAAAKKEKGLLKAVFMASAVLDRIDDQLDAISDAVAPIARVEDKAQPVPTLMPLLYGSQSPSVFKRPHMSSQFEEMKSWPGVLTATTNPTLKEYAGPLTALLAEGDSALDAARTAESDTQQFRRTGDRRALADSLDGLRKGTHGKLGELAKQKKFATGYAESFFRRESAPREPSLAEIERRLTSAQEEVDRLEAKRKELVAVAAASEKARADARRKSLSASLAAAEQLAAETKARIDALKAEIDQEPDPEPDQ